MSLDGKLSTAAELASRIEGRVVVQDRVDQHEAVAALHPASVNTVRLVTVLRGDRAAPFVAGCRIGTRGSVTDNRSTGGISVRVDLESGCLRGRGFYQPGQGHSVHRHPDTGVLLDGSPLPGLDRGVEIACRFHEDLCVLRTVGWDLALTADGPLLLEGNVWWSHNLHQSTEANFRRRLEDVWSGPPPNTESKAGAVLRDLVRGDREPRARSVAERPRDRA